jgi:phage terminase small subunit
MNTRQQRFAEMVASGTTTAKDAHRAIYGTEGHAAEVGGSRLLKNPEVAAPIARIRGLGLGVEN